MPDRTHGRGFTLNYGDNIMIIIQFKAATSMNAIHGLASTAKRSFVQSRELAPGGALGRWVGPRIGCAMKTSMFLLDRAKLHRADDMKEWLPNGRRVDASAINDGIAPSGRLASADTEVVDPVAWLGSTT